MTDGLGIFTARHHHQWFLLFVSNRQTFFDVPTHVGGLVTATQRQDTASTLATVTRYSNAFAVWTPSNVGHTFAHDFDFFFNGMACFGPRPYFDETSTVATGNKFAVGGESGGCCGCFVSLKNETFVGFFDGL